MGHPVFRTDLTVRNNKRVVEVRKELSAAVKAGASNVLPFPASEPADLARTLLFRGANSAFGLLGNIHPFFDGEPHPSSLEGLDIVIGRLCLGRIKPVEGLGVDHCGSPMVFGGPVSNREAAFIFGKGSLSPLLRTLLPFSFRYWDRMGEAVENMIEPWELLVDGIAAPKVKECLIITVLPAGDADRIISIAGLHGAGTRAIDLVLGNDKLLDKLERDTRSLAGWQLCADVIATDNESPIGLGETLLREVRNVDFDRIDYLNRCKLFWEASRDREPGGVAATELLDKESLLETIGEDSSSDEKVKPRNVVLRRSGEGARVSTTPLQENNVVRAKDRDINGQSASSDQFLRRRLEEMRKKGGGPKEPDKELLKSGRRSPLETIFRKRK